jgi:hypothetical protein
MNPHAVEAHYLRAARILQALVAWLGSGENGRGRDKSVKARNGAMSWQLA